MKKTLLLIFTIFIIQFASAQITSNKGNTPIAYDIVEVRPEFPGGINEFIKFIGKNYNAPEVEGLSGVIKVTFIIEIDGSISDIKIVNDLGQGSGEEAKRVLLKCPKWMPGEQEGKQVRVIYTLPITLRGY
jgi:hypothetical protein